ncbi:MAG: DUF3298 domain-containing protein [Thermaurantimonas sp.]|uniref:DUF3298 and DUF4163 domain-containing protein n=1 Tax=Thermaurantimonas sp. TaxID=2681568 RepID=UPI00391ABC6E
MRLLISFLFVAFIFNIISCQYEDGSSGFSNQNIDSIQYSIKNREKQIGDCSSDLSPCMTIKIQTLDIKSGVSDKVAVNIELDIEKEILYHEGDETSTAKNLDELVDILIEEYRNLLKEFPDYDLPWETTYTLNVLYNKNGLLSIDMYSYTFRGGAHGIETSKILNYNLYNGNRLKLDSVLIVNDNLVKICEKYFRKAKGIGDNVSYENTIYFIADNEFFIPDNFTITDTKIKFFYNPYEIAPYSEGIVDFEVDLQAIRPFIKSEIILNILQKAQKT